MRVIFKSDFSVSPGPAEAREIWAQARPAARKIIIYQPGPGSGLQVSGPLPAQPAKYNWGPARRGPWAAGRPGPRAEARPVQDPSVNARVDASGSPATRHLLTSADWPISFPLY